MPRRPDEFGGNILRNARNTEFDRGGDGHETECIT